MTPRVRTSVIVGVVTILILGAVGFVLYRKGVFRPQAVIQQQNQLFPSIKVFGQARAHYKNDDCKDSDLSCSTAGKSQTGYFEWLSQHRDAVWAGGRDNSLQGDVWKLHDYRTRLGLTDSILTFLYTRLGDDHDQQDYYAGGREEMMDFADQNSKNYEDFYLHYGEDATLTGFRSYPEWYPQQIPSVEDRFYYLYEYSNSGGYASDKLGRISSKLVEHGSDWYFDQNQITLDTSTSDILIGSFDKFYTAWITIPTGKGGNAGFSGQWEYCSQADATKLCATNGWKTFGAGNQFRDQTDQLRAPGTFQVYFVPPADWARSAATTVNDMGYGSKETNKYWYIRFHITSQGSGQLPTIQKLSSADYIRFGSSPVGVDNSFNFQTNSQTADRGCSPWPSWDGRQQENYRNYPQAACYHVPGWDPRNDLNGDGFVDDQELATPQNPYAQARLRSQARAPFSFLDYPSYIRNFAALTGFYETYYKKWMGFDQGHGTHYDGFISDNPVSFGDWNGTVVYVNGDTVQGGEIDPNNGYGLGYFAEYNKNTWPSCQVYNYPPPNERYNNYCTREAVSGNSDRNNQYNHQSGLWDQNYGAAMDNLSIAIKRDVGTRFLGYNPADGVSKQIEQSLDAVLKEDLLRSKYSYDQFEKRALPAIVDLQRRGKSIIMDYNPEMLDFVAQGGETETPTDRQNPYSPLKSRQKRFGIGQFLLASDNSDYYGFFTPGTSRSWTTDNPTGFQIDQALWSDLVTKDLGQPTNVIPAWATQGGAQELTIPDPDNQAQQIPFGKGVFVFKCGAASDSACTNTDGTKSSYRIYGREYDKSVVFVKWGGQPLSLSAGQQSFHDKSIDHGLGIVAHLANADNSTGAYFDTIHQLENFDAVIALKTDYQFTTSSWNNALEQHFNDGTLFSLVVPAGALSGNLQIVGKQASTALSAPAGMSVVSGTQHTITLTDGTKDLHDVLPQFLTVKFSYDGLDLGGAAPENLLIGKCDNGTCLAIPTTVDTATKTLTANQINTLSDFVVLTPGGNGGRTPPPGTATPPPGTATPPSGTATPTSVPGATATPTPEGSPANNPPLDTNNPNDIFKNFVAEKPEITTSNRGSSGISSPTSLGKTGVNTIPFIVIGIGALLVAILL